MGCKHCCLIRSISTVVPWNNISIGSEDIITANRLSHVIRQSERMTESYRCDVSPLESAIMTNDLTSVRTIVELGVDINALDRFSSTPLLQAMHFRHWEVAQYILAQPKVNINHINSKGRCALLYACVYDNEDMTRKLLSLGADAAIKSKDGFILPSFPNILIVSPFSAACVHGNVALVEELVKRGVSINTMFQEQQTRDHLGDSYPLLVACSYGHVKLFQYLYYNSADMDATDSEGCNVFHHLADCISEEFSLEILKFIFSKSKLKEWCARSVNALNKAGLAPLHIACDKNKDRCGELLAHQKVVDVNIRDRYFGMRPLQYASRHQNLSMTRILVEYGACVELIENSLDKACEKGVRKGDGVARKNSTANDTINASTMESVIDVVSARGINSSFVN